MKIIAIICFLLTCSISFAQTKKEENFKILVSNVWAQDVKNRVYSDKVPENAKPIFKEFEKTHFNYYKPNNILETYNFLTKEKIAVCKWDLSEDGTKLILESGENAIETFKYALELKEISKKKIVFGESSDKQYRGFVGRIYIPANQ